MFDFLFNPNGRVSRKGIWTGYLLPYIAASIVATQVDFALATGGGGLISDTAVRSDVLQMKREVALAVPGAGMFSLLLSLFYFWPSIAVSVKRFHDRGMTGWWVLIFLVAIAAALVGTVMTFLAAAVANPSGHGEGSMASVVVMAVITFGLLGAQFVILYLLPGTEGPNRYGPDPLDRTAQFEQSEQETSGGGWGDVDAHIKRSGHEAASPKVKAPRAGRPVPATPLVSPGAGRPAFGRRGA